MKKHSLCVEFCKETNVFLIAANNDPKTSRLGITGPDCSCSCPSYAYMELRIRVVFAFTLIELVLALMIFMLVILVAGTGLVVIQRSWEKCRENNQRLSQIMLIDKIVDSNFSNIIPFEWRDEQGRRRQIFFGDSDKVIFASTHGVNTVRDGAIRFLTLRVDAGKLLAEYGSTPILYWDSRTAPQHSEVIAENVSLVEFSYADFDAEKNLIWDSDWDERKRRNIPVAVMMRVIFENGGRMQWLKRTAGTGRDDSYGRRHDEKR